VVKGDIELNLKGGSMPRHPKKKAKAKAKGKKKMMDKKKKKGR